MKNSKFNSFDVKKTCENKLKIDFKQGKELNGWFEFEGKKIARITVSHGRKKIKPKTYSSMASQLKLNVLKFDDLLECPLKLDGYIKLLKQKNII